MIAKKNKANLISNSSAHLAPVAKILQDVGI